MSEARDLWERIRDLEAHIDALVGAPPAGRPLAQLRARRVAARQSPAAIDALHITDALRWQLVALVDARLARRAPTADALQAMRLAAFYATCAWDGVRDWPRYASWRARSARTTTLRDGDGYVLPDADPATTAADPTNAVEVIAARSDARLVAHAVAALPPRHRHAVERVLAGESASPKFEAASSALRAHLVSLGLTRES